MWWMRVDLNEEAQCYRYAYFVPNDGSAVLRVNERAVSFVGISFGRNLARDNIVAGFWYLPSNGPVAFVGDSGVDCTF